jgi:hypothetical protein
VLSKPTLIEAIGSGRVGIGQLFKTFGLRPRFALQSACRLATDKLTDTSTELDSLFVGGLRRRYTLSALGVECDITEWLPSDAFKVQSRQADDGNCEKGGDDVDSNARGNGAESQSQSHFGDIMVRLLSSYLNKAVSVRVLRLEQLDHAPRESSEQVTNQRAGRRFMRQVALVCDVGQKQQQCGGCDGGVNTEESGGAVVIEATSKICVEDDQLIDAIENGRCEIGADMFRFLDVIPEFTLVSFRKSTRDQVSDVAGDGLLNNDDMMLVREYTLAAAGVRISLSEVIDVACITRCAVLG